MEFEFLDRPVVQLALSAGGQLANFVLPRIMDKLSGISTSETDEKLRQKDLEIEKLTTGLENIKLILNEEKNARIQLQNSNFQILEQIAKEQQRMSQIQMTSTTLQQQQFNQLKQQQQQSSQTAAAKQSPKSKNAKSPNVYLPPAVLKALAEGKNICDRNQNWVITEFEDESDEESEEELIKEDQDKKVEPLPHSYVEELFDNTPSKPLKNQRPAVSAPANANNTIQQLPYPNQPNPMEMFDLNAFCDLANVVMKKYTLDEIPPHLQRVKKRDVAEEEERIEPVED
jgi:hypothetical protein